LYLTPRFTRNQKTPPASRSVQALGRGVVCGKEMSKVGPNASTGQRCRPSGSIRPTQKKRVASARKSTKVTQPIGYGCTTCIGNSGPLHPALEEAIAKHDLAASVLSANRNFEARVHQNIRANFLMSPPLVVAFALAGTVNIDLSSEPLGKGQDRQERLSERNLAFRWRKFARPCCLRSSRKSIASSTPTFAEQNPKWNAIPSSTGEVYE
jgi:hypothetical protein